MELDKAVGAYDGSRVVARALKRKHQIVLGGQDRRERIKKSPSRVIPEVVY